jgi:hypothetical protein
MNGAFGYYRDSLHWTVMNLTNALTILAILLGPIMALMIQRDLDKKRERDKRRREVFRTLWSTKTFPGRLHFRHVEALNMIGLEFAGKRAVLEAWKEYLDFLNQPVPETGSEQFYRERNSKFTELIFAISQDLGYEFSRLEVERLDYSPNAHNTWAEQETIFRQHAVAVLQGHESIPIRIVTGDDGERPKTALRVE